MISSSALNAGGSFSRDHDGCLEVGRMFQDFVADPCA